MRKLWLLGMGIVILGYPCGCAETAGTCAWTALFQSILTWVQQIGSTGT